MMQQELIQKNLASVGEEISHELGAKMVKDYIDANPNDVKAYYIGRNIIEEILAQPSCVGIRFYNAINEQGKKTLVYVGVDETGKSIAEYTVVNKDGSISIHQAKVADRAQNTEDTGIWEKIWKLFF